MKNIYEIFQDNFYEIFLIKIFKDNFYENF